MHLVPTPSQPDRRDDPLTIGEQNAISTHELVVASGEVITKRLAVGLSGMIDPANADHAEPARLVPEKSAAISASATALLERSGQFVERVASFTTDEIMLASRACVLLTACRTPAAFIAAQQGRPSRGSPGSWRRRRSWVRWPCSRPATPWPRFTVRRRPTPDAWAAPDPGTDVSVAEDDRRRPPRQDPPRPAARTGNCPTTLGSRSLPQLDDRASGSADLLRHLGLARHRADGVGDLPRHRVVDHVPGVGDQQQLAAGNGVVEPGRLVVHIDDPILHARHDRDRQLSSP